MPVIGTNTESQLAAVRQLMDWMFPEKHDYVLYSCAGDRDRSGCSLRDAVKVATGRNVEDVDARTVPSTRIAVLHDKDRGEWCVWNGYTDTWDTVSGDEDYHFSIQYRGAP